MFDVTRRVSYRFNAPYLLIGYKKPKNTLELVNGVVLPDSNNHFLLKFYESDIAQRINERDHISLSFVHKMDNEKQFRRDIKNHLITHSRMQLPIHKEVDYALKMEVVLKQTIDESEIIYVRPLYSVCKHESKCDIELSELKTKSIVRVYNMTASNMKSRQNKNQAYHFNFKYKICRLKEEGKTYKDLAKDYGVYHETIKDWYLLYKVFGREGLTKKMAKELAIKKLSESKKRELARSVINGERSYRSILEKERVSLSRIKNWVKKERKSLP